MNLVIDATREDRGKTTCPQQGTRPRRRVSCRSLAATGITVSVDHTGARRVGRFGSAQVKGAQGREEDGRSSHSLNEVKGGIIPDEDKIDEAARNFRRLCNETMELLVTIGLISSVSSRWPDDVQTSWFDRVTEIRDFVKNQSNEAQQFASSYD